MIYIITIKPYYIFICIVIIFIFILGIKKLIFIDNAIEKKSSAPHEGIEPSTTSLKGWRSTAELTRLLAIITIFKFLSLILH